MEYTKENIGSIIKKMNNNENSKVLRVNQLKWEDRLGYTTNGNITNTTFFNEAQRHINKVIEDSMSNVSFSSDTTTMEYYNSIKENILYSVMMEYKAGRYNAPNEMMRVLNLAYTYLWKLFDMDNNYDEKQENNTII